MLFVFLLAGLASGVWADCLVQSDTAYCTGLGPSSVATNPSVAHVVIATDMWAPSSEVLTRLFPAVQVNTPLIVVCVLCCGVGVGAFSRVVVVVG